jgi:hypothetical protein
MVRQMARWSEVPSTDPMGNKIYEFCNDPLGKKCMAFPNFFITIAPAEWLFPLPSWLQQMVANDRLSNVSGMVALLGTRIGSDFSLTGGSPGPPPKPYILMKFNDKHKHINI